MEEKIKSLLCHSDALMRHVYWFYQDFEIVPRKNHIGASIQYTDINERRHDFVSELNKTVVGWVYSKARQRAIFQQRLGECEGDIGQASSHLVQLARRKFRRGYPQGQFGELVLFNFIQYFFGSPPLLRKMPITTSEDHERFGADALHIKVDSNKNMIILGESKCYKSDYRFIAAFEKSVESVIDSFSRLDEELDLYIYDDFIDVELQKLAVDYKEGRLEGVVYELVCIVIYNETKSLPGETEEEIKDGIKKIVSARCSSVDSSFFKNYDSTTLSRVNYIIFPVWELDKLLKAFEEG